MVLNIVSRSLKYIRTILSVSVPQVNDDRKQYYAALNVSDKKTTKSGPKRRELKDETIYSGVRFDGNQ